MVSQRIYVFSLKIRSKYKNKCSLELLKILVMWQMVSSSYSVPLDGQTSRLVCKSGKLADTFGKRPPSPRDGYGSHGALLLEAYPQGMWPRQRAAEASTAQR